MAVCSRSVECCGDCGDRLYFWLRCVAGNCGCEPDGNLCRHDLDATERTNVNRAGQPDYDTSAGGQRGADSGLLVRG
jgi:hypothetical protein